MKSTFYLFLFFFSIGLEINAQDSLYYYYKGDTIDLELDLKHLNIRVGSDFNESQISSLGYFQPFTLSDDYSTDVANPSKFGKLEFTSTPSSNQFYRVVESLEKISDFKNASYHFRTSDSTSIGTSHLFYVKLNSESDYGLLQSVANQKNVEIVRQIPNMPRWYCLSLTEDTESFSVKLANEFYETGYFEAVDPAFMFDFKTNPINGVSSGNGTAVNCATDPDFDELWGLQNNTDPTYDINICNAWQLSEGNGVKVAVFDRGIYKEHPDLQENIYSFSFDAENGTSPSIYSPEGMNYGHGTHIAGTIAAVKDNEIDVVGVAPKSKLMSVSYNQDLIGVDTAQKLASGFNWAWQNGADVINCSFGTTDFDVLEYFHSIILEESIESALIAGRDGKGTVVVFCSGNESLDVVGYPGNANDNNLIVGAINHLGRRPFFSNYGDKLDVVAPGLRILSTIPENGIEYFSGTSMAAPHVSGIAALLISLNPCLTGQEVRDIIEQTAQKVGRSNAPPNAPIVYNVSKPNGMWNEEWGYGLVDAEQALFMAEAYLSGAPDLFIKDSPEDEGYEPNEVTEVFWNSRDIWVRNSDDGETQQTHQNPIGDQENFVYVKIGNRGCAESTGNDSFKLVVHWAKAGTSLPFPQNWDGTWIENGVPMGGIIDTISIPPILPGNELIIEIPWNVPDPELYEEFAEPQHFCLLARIISDDDPMTFPETGNVGENTRNNNNIAWRNLTVIDTDAFGPIGGTISVANPYNTTKNFDLLFNADDKESGKLIFEEAEVSVILNERLYDAWVAGGSQLSSGIQQDLSSIANRNRFIISSDDAKIKNLVLDRNEYGLMALRFNVLTKEVTSKQEFNYHVTQIEVPNDSIIGGETYVIRKPPRSIFYANANDVSANRNETITLVAEDINENAVYNWYDAEGELIYTGTELTVVADIAKTYKLEIIADADGYKDYKEVEVALNPNTLNNLLPNPASQNVTIDYTLNLPSSAYLHIVGYLGNDTGVERNYILDTMSTEKVIDLSGYATGYYNVALVCDGQVVGTLNLIKN